MSAPRLAGLVLLLLLCVPLFFHRLSQRDLWSSHEARAAQDAQTILDDGHWGLPRLYHGEVELQKPPLYYWLVAGLAWCRGGTVDTWAVRLPATLSALGCVLLLYLLGLRRGRPLAGLVAAAMLATALHFTWLARVGRIDMPLTLTVTLALLAYDRVRQGASSVWLLLLYLALAAGLLLKGPVGAVLPLAVIFAHQLTERELLPWQGRSWFTLGWRFRLWWGVPLTLAVALPWYLWANAQTQGELFRVFFWHHNVERGLGGSDTLRAHPWWFYGPHLAGDFLPWSLLLPAAAWFLVRRRRWQADAEARLGLVWLLTILLLLSCARFKRADYLLPAFPGAALFLGCVVERCYLESSSRRRCALLVGFTLALTGCLVGWGAYLTWVLPRGEPVLEERRFAAEIRRHAPAPQGVVFFWLESHPLAFHVGRPLDILVEWQDLDARAAQPQPTYVVMPAEVAAEWPRHLHAGRLQEVLRNTDLPGEAPRRAGATDRLIGWVLDNTVLSGRKHRQPLVLLRTQPLSAPAVPPSECDDVRLPRPAADRHRTAQCRAAGAP